MFLPLVFMAASLASGGMNPDEEAERLVWGSAEAGLGVLQGFGVLGRVVGPHVSLDLGLGIPPFYPAIGGGAGLHGYLQRGGYGGFAGVGVGPWGHRSSGSSSLEGDESESTSTVIYARFVDVGWRLMLRDQAPYVPVTIGLVIPFATRGQLASGEAEGLFDLLGPPVIGHLSAGIQF